LAELEGKVFVKGKAHHGGGRGEEPASNDRNKTTSPPRDAMLGGGVVRLSLEARAPYVGTNEYAELKWLIKQQELLDKQPAYYTYKICEHFLFRNSRVSGYCPSGSR